jgi:small subunit ribosomal protein S16
MLVMRFFRIGKKNQSAFKIVVTDKRNPPKGGKFVEEVGFWNPLTKEKILKGDRIKYWLSVGAQPSASVHNLLVKEKIIEGEKIPKHKKKKEEKQKERA